MFRMRKVALSELPSIAAALRPIDAKEVQLGGYTPLSFLQMAHGTCEVFYVMEHHLHGVVAIGGALSKADSEYGECGAKTAWLLNTVAVESCRIEYLRESRWLWEYGFKETKSDRLCNFVWQGNEDHIKWLKWCGATFDSEVYDSHYLFFEMRKENVRCG